MAKTVIGLFEQASDADATVRDLESAGVPRDAISVARRNEAQLDARLMDAGIPERDARLFVDGVQQGNSLVVVQGIADDDAEEAAAIMDRHNVVDLGRREPSYQRMSLERTTSGTASAGPMNTNLYQGQDMVVPIVEEQLRIGKRAVEGGGVRVRTRVEEVPVNEQVTLRDEEVQVERRRVDRPVSGAELDAIQEGTFEVRETDEEAVVDKQARVVEEVVVKKDVAERTETVQDTVRRTDVDVEEVSGQTTTGTVRQSGATAGRSVDADATGSASDEGAIERGASKLGNAVERATGADIDSDGDVGRRDPRNNI